MSIYPLPPNPCLIAIVLVTRTSSDPSIVFHYPPRPGEDNSRFKQLFKDSLLDDESSTSSSGEDSQDSSTEPLKVKQNDQIVGKQDSPPDAEGLGSGSPEKPGGIQPALKWNDLFGFQSLVLAKMLCPPVIAHKKRFEVGLGEKVMLGRPVFARSDGTWKKPKKSRRSLSRGSPTAEKTKRAEDVKGSKVQLSGIDEKDQGEAPITDVSAESQPENDRGVIHKETGLETEQIHQSTQKDGLKRSKSASHTNVLPLGKKKALTMFNVVYILQPPPLEYHLRVEEMYDHIVRKFSKALKWEQSHSNYVATEAALISSVANRSVRNPAEKQYLGNLYHEILSQSSLAKAIANLYNSITNLRIAHINLSSSLSLSLQIPIATSILTLPTPLSPQLPGLWLTTANSLPTDDETQTSGTQLGSHFTLLLLSDLHSILSDVNASTSPITDALTHYLRVSTPTKSFYQISQTSHIPLSHIQFLASHLIYWRRARAIPPLHQRDTYIVSPNADMRKLSSAASTFAKLFPALPSLPQILSTLSSRVRPYSSLIPSKDHKEAYMDILAWLMRGGWVTQLRTFAWVRVPSHIKAAVAKEDAANRSSRSPQESETEDSESVSGTNDSEYPSISYLDVPQSDSSLNKSPSRARSPSSSTHTTLHIPQTKIHHLPSLIVNPSLASDLPSRHLSAISKHILDRQGAESHSAWTKCIKYFDGKHALETIPVREGWKRKKVKELVDGWVELGLLTRGRHW